MADDDLTLVVHEHVEKVLARLRGRVWVALFATQAAVAVVYFAARDVLVLTFLNSAMINSIVVATSCRSPLFYMVEDLCRLHELQPGNGHVLVLLSVAAVSGTAGFSILVYYAGLSVWLIRRIYGHYLVGNLRYTLGRFLWIGLGVVGALFNTAMQSLSAHYRSYNVERMELQIAPNERFLLTVGSNWFLYWALFQIFQFTLFAALVGLRRVREAKQR